MSVEIPEVQIGPPNGVKDLSKLPLQAEAVNLAAIAFQDAMIEKKFTDQFNSMVESIEIGPKAGDGHLLSINVYFTGDQVIIPDGQLVSSIGSGRDPFEAYAKTIISGTVRPKRAVAANDHSSLIWIRRSRDGSIMASQIPTRGRDEVQRIANIEAKRLKRLSSFYKPGPVDAARRVQIAEYWADQYQKNKKRIKSSEVRQKIESLNSRMAEAQERLNGALQEHQKIVFEMNKHAERVKVFKAVDQIAGIIRLGVRADKLFSPRTDGKKKSPIKAGGEAPFNIKKGVGLSLGYHGDLDGTRVDLEISAKSDFGTTQDLGRKMLEVLIEQLGPESIAVPPASPAPLQFKDPEPLPPPSTPGIVRG